MTNQQSDHQAVDHDRHGELTLKASPRWLRMALLYVLFAIAIYQISGWLFHHIRGFLGLLFVAWLVSITMEPVVEWLENRGMRRGVAAGLVLLGIFGGFVGFVAMFGTLLADQIVQLLHALPDAIVSVTEWANRTFDTDFKLSGELQDLSRGNISDLAQRFAPGILGFVSVLVGAIFQILTMLLFVFYMSAQGPAMRRTISSWFPARQQRVISRVWLISVEKAGGYVVSRLILGALSAVVFAIFFVIIDVPYWLPLALWVGVVSQFIPTLGTYLAIGLPALVAAADVPAHGLWVIIFGTVYQQIENYLLHPRITSRTVAIHPAVAFGAVIVGASLFGATGALVSVPVVAVIQALIQTYGQRYELVNDEDAAALDKSLGKSVPDRPDE